MSQSLFKATQRSSGETSSAEVDTTPESSTTPAPSTTTQETTTSSISTTTIKEEHNSVGSFLQAADETEEKHFTKVAPNEIVLDGVTYKKVAKHPKPRRNKKKQQQTTPTKLITAAPDASSTTQSPIPLPAQLSAHTKFTPEQQQIIYSLQRQYLEQQQEALHKQNKYIQQPVIDHPVTKPPRQQPLLSPPPPAPETVQYFVNRNTQQYPSPQVMVNQESVPSSYYGKLNVPQSFVEIPQNFLTTAPPQRPSIQVQQINPQAPTLPMQKQYSLEELGEYYKSVQATQLPTIEKHMMRPTTTEATIHLDEETVEESIYKPHKQVKIQMNVSQFC